MARTGRVDRDRVVGAVSMDPCRGAGEVDTGTTVITVPVSGAEGGFRAEGDVSEDTPAQPPRAVLFYTLPELRECRSSSWQNAFLVRITMTRMDQGRSLMHQSE